MVRHLQRNRAQVVVRHLQRTRAQVVIHHLNVPEVR